MTQRQPQHDPRQQQAVTPPRPAAAKRKRNWGCWVFAGLFAAGGVIFGVAEAVSSGSTPPTPYQQCVTSIQQEDTSTQVLGYTPQCLAIPLDQRLAAIKQATTQG